MSMEEKHSKEKAAQEAAVPMEAALKAAKKAAAGTAQKTGGLMYLGPTIAGAARHGTVFKDGALPKKALECITEFPPLGLLFVRADKVPGAARELRDKKSVLAAVYSKAAAHFARRNR